MRIVVVDDDHAVVRVTLRMISRVLPSDQYEIIGVHTVREAVDKLVDSTQAEQRVWLVTDYNLGGTTTGCDLIASALAAGVPLQRVAIMSGRLTPYDEPGLACPIPVQIKSKPLTIADCRAMITWLLAV